MPASANASDSTAVTRARYPLPQGRHRTDAGFFTFEQVEPRAQRAGAEELGELGQVGVERPLGEVRALEQLADRSQNFGSSAATVRWRPSCVS
jgi:hypothetical protein